MFLKSFFDTPMLSDTTCKNAKAKDKPYKISDEKGMFLLVNPNGAKYFRFKYRINGKEKLALGVYPDTSLKQTREKRNEAKKQLAEKIDPSENRKEIKIAQSYSFEHAIREWLASTRGDDDGNSAVQVSKACFGIILIEVRNMRPKNMVIYLRITIVMLRVNKHEHPFLSILQFFIIAFGFIPPTIIYRLLNLNFNTLKNDSNFSALKNVA